MEKTSSMQSEKLGKMPIGRLLLVMSLPAILSMLVQSLYNVVDTIFVSHITSENNDALAALGLAFPMQMIVFSVALGIGVGTNSLVARKLGAGDNGGASRIAQTGMKLAIIAAIIFAAVGYFLVNLFMSVYDTAKPEVVQMAKDYLYVIVIACMGQFIEVVANKILQSTGNMVVPMVSQLIGAITNIILDPIMIFGLFGLPKMGVIGAAVATVIGQWVAMTYTLIMILRKKRDVTIFTKDLSIKGNDVKEIARIGAPAFATNSVGAIVTMSMNLILMGYVGVGETAVSVLSVYFKLQSFVFMPVFGLTQGAMPVLGYNYGANIKQRFDRAFKLTLITSISIMSVGFGLFQLLPEFLLQIFNADTALTVLGARALRTISFSFFGAAFGIVFSIMFQAVGEGLKALLMPLCRQLLFLLPCALLIKALSSDVNLVWLCYPVAEFLAAFIFVPIGIATIKKVFKRKSLELSSNQ